MTSFILICGLNKSRKTETAKRMAQMLEKKGKTVEIKSFATPLKQFAAMYFNYTEETKYEQRPMLEKLAFDMKALLGQPVFAYTLLDNSQYVKADYIIVDDLRYPIEFDIITEFFETTVVKMPDPEITEQSDVDRLNVLVDRFKAVEYQHLDLKDFTDRSLKAVLLDV